MEHLSRIFAKAGLTVDNGATFNGLVNANTDTDRFLVADNGVLKFRTGAEILSDIGGASSASGLPIGGTAGQILAKIDATNYNTEWIDNFTTDVRQYVKAGEAINKGQAVYISSADGTNPIVSKASNASEATSSKTLGLLAQNLSHNGFGYVITEGRLSGLDTSSAQIADPVWLGTNGNLIFGLANKPIAPAHLVYLGVVTRVNQNNGEIFVHVQNGVELNEIHDVLIQSVANKDILYRDASTNLWKNASIATVLGFTPADNAALANYQLTSQKAQPNGYASLDGNGKVPLAQMNDSIIGQVEYMGLWNAATNTPTLSSTPQQKGHYYIVSAAGTQFGITFEIGDWIISDGTTWSKVDNTDAVSSVFGRVGNVAAAEADYQSFYPRLSQVYANPSWISELAWSKITGTPTTLAGYGITDAVPSSRTITINGTTYDLSANRTWTISEADTLATVTARGNTTSANVFLGQYLRTGSYPHFGETVGGLATLVGNNVLPGTGVNKIVRYAGGDNGTYIILRYNAGIIFGTALASTVGSEVDDTSAEAMRITTNRNVLINTSVDTGDYRLDANGFFRLGPSTGHNISIGPNYQFRSLVSNTIITQDSENISLYANNTGNIVLGTQAVPRFAVNNNGTITASSLSGTGTRMVVSDSSGVLSTQAIPVGTVTSVGLSTGTSGTDVNVSGSPVTGSGVITFNIPTASATNRGLLSTADWTTFNNKVSSIIAGNAITVSNASGNVTVNHADTSGADPGATISGSNVFRSIVLDTYGHVTGLSYSSFLISDLGGTAISSPSNGQVLSYNGTNWVNSSLSGLSIITGSGTTNWVPKFTSSSAIGLSNIYDGSSFIGVFTATDNLSGAKLQVNGGAYLKGTNAGQLILDNDNSQYVQLLLQRNSTANTGGDILLDGTNNKFNIRVLSTASFVVSTSSSAGSPIERFTISNTGAATFSSSVTAGSPISVKGTTPFFRWLNDSDVRLAYIQHNASNLIYNADTGSHVFNQNVGIGATPSAWTAFNPVLQVKTGSLAGSGTANFRMFANTYYDGSYKYIGTGTATQYEQDGYHAWYTAPSGSANAAITFTQAMTLTSGGLLGIGATNPTRSLQITRTSTAFINAEGSVVAMGSSDTELRLYGNNTETMTLKSGNVGIGTASPTTLLSLAGSASTTFGLSISASGWNDARHRLTIPTSGDTSVWSWNYNGSAIDSASYGTSTISVGNGVLTFSTNTTNTAPTERMRITSGGDVQVTKTTGTLLDIRATNTGGTAELKLNPVNNNNYSLYTSGSTDALQFLRNGSEQMRITNVGNVGLGVTPSAWSTFTAMQIKNASFAGQANFAYMGANYYYDGTNNRYIASDFASRYQQFNGIHQWLTASSGTAGNIITFSSAMTLDASGRLGIGTTSPSYRLDISGSSMTRGTLVIDNNGTDTSPTEYLRFERNSQGSTNYFNSIYSSTGSGTNLMQFRLSNTSGSQGTIMTLTGTGNVGIGTATPSYKLDVQNNGDFDVRIKDTTLGGTVGILFEAANDFSGTSQAYVKGILSGNSGTSQLIFGTAGSSGDVTATERMRITSSGSVLIGNTAGNGYKLEVFGSTQAGNTFGQTFAGVGAYSQWITSGGAFAMGLDGAAGATERLRITSSGRVLIGTTTDNTIDLLQVAGSGRFSNNFVASGYSAFGRSVDGSYRVIIQGQGTTSSTFGISATDSGGNQNFWVRDDGAGYLRASAWTYGSDKRIKENISYIESGIDKVMKLKPATFDYIDGAKNNIGWIAQDIQEVIPEAVSIVNAKGQLGLKSEFIVPYLVKAIQELKTELDTLKK
jgi:hypothetical protein